MTKMPDYTLYFYETDMC